MCSSAAWINRMAFWCDNGATKLHKKWPTGICRPLLCGESEIRTRDTLLGYTRFPGVPLQPLEHLSFLVNIRMFMKSGCKGNKKNENSESF